MFVQNTTRVLPIVSLERVNVMVTEKKLKEPKRKTKNSSELCYHVFNIARSSGTVSEALTLFCKQKQNFAKFLQ